eukprot:8773425-Alexandrium_andersonii.AAC.1
MGSCADEDTCSSERRAHDPATGPGAPLALSAGFTGVGEAAERADSGMEAALAAVLRAPRDAASLGAGVHPGPDAHRAQRAGGALPPGP